LIVFINLSIVGFLGGIFLFILWFRDRSSLSKCVNSIKSRLPPVEGIQELSFNSKDNQNS
jgi:hypothetical protein